MKEKFDVPIHRVLFGTDRAILLIHISVGKATAEERCAGLFF